MIVLDSSFLIAFHNEGDVHHERAAGVMERILADEWGPALLLEYVFLEVVTVLRLRVDHAAAVAVGEALLSAREVRFVPCSELFSETLETFRVEGDSALSFVDAAIAAVARRDANGLVATFDGDFQGLTGVKMVPAP